MKENPASLRGRTYFLAGRLAFPNWRLKDMIQKGGKRPRGILVAYNLSKGKTPISIIVDKAGIMHQAMLAADDRWADLRIVLEKK